MRIPYARTLFTEEEYQAAEQAMRSGQWVYGDYSKKFEQELAENQGTNYSVFVNSGSSALLLSLLALKDRYKSGEVIVPAIQFPTLLNSVIMAGFTPVIVDVDQTLCLSFNDAIEAINEETVGICLVHVAGNIGRVDEFANYCKAHGLFLLEDNCDGFGGFYGSKRVGSFGDISVTSFHMAHIISTGQGGAVFTDYKDLADSVRSYCDWGRMIDFDDNGPGVHPLPHDHMQRYTYVRRGLNMIPLELQAAIGSVQLKQLGIFVDNRRVNHDRISDAALDAGFILPHVLTKSYPAWFAVPLICPNTKVRSKVLIQLKTMNVEYRNILSGNIALHPIAKGVKIPLVRGLENAQRVAESGFWVSCHSSLDNEELEYLERVIRTIK